MKPILCKQFGWFELEITDVSRTESKLLNSQASSLSQPQLWITQSSETVVLTDCDRGHLINYS